MKGPSSVEQHPRLMVASEFPPNASGGGPAVVRQMLKHWPAQNLVWWSCRPERDQLFGQQVANLRTAAIPPKLYPSKRWVRLKSWLLDHVWTPWAARDLLLTLRQLAPDVVWAIPHNWAIPPLARALPRSGFPFHTTVQDYADPNANLTRFGPERARKLASLADGLYSSACTRDATSHPMIDDLRQRTGCEAAQMLHAGLEASDFAYLAAKDANPDGHIHIAHAGTIIVEHDFAFFIDVLARIRSQISVPLSLEFFGSHDYAQSHWFDRSWMREHGNLAEPALAEALRRCTWGFAPMSLSDDNPRYNRFSFPTKFINYLAAGLPVIALGHPESSVIKMAKAYKVGICLTSPDHLSSARELLQALLLKDGWSMFKEGILRCGRAEFEAEKMRKVLYDCLWAGARACRDERSGGEGSGA